MTAPITIGAKQKDLLIMASNLGVTGHYLAWSSSLEEFQKPSLYLIRDQIKEPVTEYRRWCLP
ncbi:hypothetical protein ACFSM5_15730 [Lacibacterium aquatile]|uniref:Uncharacterized protein n=1 Tax=Lacibacterium aquatile TaxID=1168082 RepID=A0ABW5DV64_9PROT